MDKQTVRILRLSAAIFIILIILNLLIVFTPEIGFDALWYHLTLPKLWLFKHQWYIPGGLLYYSVMPRLPETLFIPLVKFTGYIGPKFIQFLSGLGAAYLTFRLARLAKLSRTLAFFAMMTFYITWLVAWQSGSAYIDLIRTFLELLALIALIKGKWVRGGIFLGLALGTKWLVLGSLAIYAVIFGLQIVFPALLVAAPWFIIAYHFTGNPIYPVFEPFMAHMIATPQLILKRLFLSPLVISKPPDDFLTPLAGLFLIFSLITIFKTKNHILKKLGLLAACGTFFTISIDPPSSRYLLPYFPAMIVSAFWFISKQKKVLRLAFYYLLLGSFVFVITLRLIAVKKYIPYLLGRETQEEFLYSLRGRLPDTFVDTDHFVTDNLNGSSILIDKLHNLYYFPYDFDHTSWATGTKVYDYLVTQGQDPTGVNGTLIHTNNMGIQIFRLKNARVFN